ncbi:MAG TPA: carboxylating nicotinate-nucleotide diphosphorylase [Actinomycetota bacterium]|jgi:nicotinate-nucleotide pyrophosphorylase (carboxylating)|nr:carboxylating nicotinate-nucleotide diphosphorylase [Actinomycetota bacterium]
MSVLHSPHVRAQVRGFLAEDVGRGDVTTEAVVPAELRGTARLEAREPFVVAGLPLLSVVLEEAGGGVRVEVESADGDEVDRGAALARLEGPLRTILTGERVALNLIARLSGVATVARRYAVAVSGTSARVVDTRKTTPGLRMLEKYAVRTGGAHNHRFGLDDGILVKDNHIAAAGGVTEAVGRARAAAPHGLLVEVEVTDESELEDALAAGADAVLLDNMTPDEVARCVRRAGGKALLEVSGGITLENVATYAATGVDLISCGAITHSARSVDIALEVERL